ncbi:MAG: heparin lyase I family protein [Actinobacteria bacterium]|nr:heparin lyase I family protein [Actinomycetota bacterium]
MPLPVRWSRRVTALAATAALALAALSGTAGATILAQATSLDSTLLSSFSQTNTLASTLGTDTSRAYDGTASAKASYLGNADNAYSRGVWNVNWVTGDDVWYSGAYYLPVGFKAAMQGEVDLLRWDNWPSHPTDTDWGGFVIFGSDKKGRLMRFNRAGDSRTLVGPIDVPEGRWFWLEVHQRFSPTDGQALSELYIDGTLIGRSTAGNTYGRTIERMRYGFVADGGAKQTNPLTLWFDRSRISTSQVGPLATADPAPAPAPTDPTPTPTDPTPTPTDPAPAPTTTTTDPAPAPTTTTTDPAPTTKKGHGKGVLRASTASVRQQRLQRKHHRHHRRHHKHRHHHHRRAHHARAAR